MPPSRTTGVRNDPNSGLVYRPDIRTLQPAMRSCLYECQVMHARFSPRAHRFNYRLFLFALDLDELETLAGRLKLFSLHRRTPYRFREADYLPVQEAVHNATPTAPASSGSPPQSLKERVVAYLAGHGIDLTGGRVLLVTLPRVLGYHFNPVSFYFCEDREGKPVAAIAEVTNTFREMKPFLLGPETFRRSAQGRPEFHLRVPKHFYVSPFSDVDVAFDFKLQLPGDRLSVQIDDYVGEARTLTSTLAGPAQPLTDRKLAWFAVKYPLLTLRIIALIHWHALRLFLKKVPWFRKSARAGDQRDLYRPHLSIAPAKLSDPA